MKKCSESGEKSESDQNSSKLILLWIMDSYLSYKLLKFVQATATLLQEYPADPGTIIYNNNNLMCSCCVVYNTIDTASFTPWKIY